MTQKITLRDYAVSDQAAVILIHDRARPIELQGSCDPRAFVPLLDDAEDLAEFLSVAKTLACIDGRVVGFVGVDDDQLGWLYVDPDLARQGIGRCLLRHALTCIRGTAVVHVLAGNQAALRLYTGEGFSQVERFKSDNRGYPCVVLKLARPAMGRQ